MSFDAESVPISAKTISLICRIIKFQFHRVSRAASGGTINAVGIDTKLIVGPCGAELFI